LKYLIALTLILCLDFVIAQSPGSAVAVPKVFLIGEYEDQYMALSKQHPAIFMSVYSNDIDRAFRGWSDMLMDMEDYAEELKFDIKGVKLWFNIYFNPDGTISHFAFYPKPNSRNVPVEHLSAFFKNFVAHYKLPVKADKAFHHSASGGFPTHFSSEMQATVKKD
jgi:hypothetical protein